MQVVFCESYTSVQSTIKINTASRLSLPVRYEVSDWLGMDLHSGGWRVCVYAYVLVCINAVKIILTLCRNSSTHSKHEAGGQRP